MINGRDEDRLDQAARSLRDTGAEILRLRGDVRDWAQVTTMVASIDECYGTLDVLVNNAGGHFASPLEEISPNGWHAVVDLNLTSVFYCSKACLPVFRKQGRGAILNIGSIAAFGAHPHRAHAGAAKGAVVSLTMTMAYEWAPYGVRVNCIAPGAILTDASPTSNDAKRSAEVEERVPMGRAGRPEEVAQACLFLASDSATYITGETIRVDGGPRRAV
ncbi:MAG: SDR family oxidoreductase [Streptosporangiales bacterium]|nr:SDR family oxidoreductase [Streptosporangiales bacterium]